MPQTIYGGALGQPGKQVTGLVSAICVGISDNLGLVSARRVDQRIVGRGWIDPLESM